MTFSLTLTLLDWCVLSVHGVRLYSCCCCYILFIQVILSN